MTLVIDASVALRWYIDVPESAAALALLERETPLIAPDLVIAEVSNAAWKLARAGEISRQHGERIVGAIPSAFDDLIPAERLSRLAYQISTELAHPVYDALYLALAEISKCPMVTADGRLLRRIEGTRWEGRAKALSR